MPIYAEVQGVGRLEFPDGTDPAVIQQTVKRVASGRYQTASQRRGESMEDREAALDARGISRVSNPIGNIQRGAVDIIGGGAQLLSQAAHAAGLVPESTGDPFFAGPKEVDAQNQQARQNIDQMFGKSEGFSPMRAASSALLTLPIAPTKFLQAPTMLGRSVGAGGAGATVAAMHDTGPSKDATEFWKKKGVQTGMGFAGGVLAQPLVEAVTKYVIGGLNTGADKAVAGARQLTGANSVERIESLARDALKRSGIDYDRLSDAAKSGLLDDVSKALGQYSGVNPGAVARQAAFREEGVNPLRHWVTKDPSEFTWFENVAGVPGVGDPLKNAKNTLDKHVLDRLNQMRGGQELPSDVGTAAGRDLKGFVDQEQGKTSVLYRTFQELAPNATGNPQRFANDVFGGLEGQMAGKALKPELREIVNAISSGEIPLTPSTLFQLQKMAKPGADGTQNYALGHLRKAIDREMDAISQSVGGESSRAGEVLKMARAQHAKTMGEMEGSKLLSAVADGQAVPENFTDQMLRGSLKDLAATWSKLGNDAKTGVRAQVLDEIKRKAFGGASDESGKTAAQATFNNYLSDATTAQKLRVILGDKGLQEVKRLGLMLESAHLLPSGNKVNTSNTGAAMLGFMTKGADWMKAKGIPGGTAAQNTAQNAAVQGAMAPNAGALGQRSLVIDPYMEELIKRMMGGGSALLGAPAAGGLLGFSQ